MARPTRRVWQLELGVQTFSPLVMADAFHSMFKALAAAPDFEYAMIDGSIVKVHRAGQGAKGGLKARP